ncbi:Rho guanine nucleotide exchange factor [Marasmius sp. AFHP31]|nr:Rho guanine nucleotide exchange factor [Marasmius sp. AFHP31]
MSKATNEVKGLVFEIKTILTIGGRSSEGNKVTGKVACALPFNAPDGSRLIAIGGDEGVWVGHKEDPQSLTRLLKSKNVTQIAIHEDIGVFYVLAEQSLVAYPIEAMLPSSTPNPLAQRLKRYINYFSIGIQEGKHLVVGAKSSSLSTTFVALEAVVDTIKDARTGVATSPAVRSERSDWFKTHREFYMPVESHGFTFLKSKCVILCEKARSYEVVDLKELDTQSIVPNEDFQRAVSSSLRKHSRPIGMFKMKEQLLLCFTKFGLYADVEGIPVQQNPIVEWGVSAERVAAHGTHILLFGSKSIQVRELHNGQLVQDIQGKDIRCLWDGRIAGKVMVGEGDEGDTSTRSSAIGIMKDPEGKTQHVFEIVTS